MSGVAGVFWNAAWRYGARFIARRRRAEWAARATAAARWGWTLAFERRTQVATSRHAIVRLSAPRRLALEMAVHEDAERRAMEGELAELERAWREAEEVAAIADGLLLPAGVEERVERLRRRGPAGGLP